VHIADAKRRKLDAKSTPFILLGYDNEAKAYRLWNAKTHRLVLSRDVVFDERSFPGATHVTTPSTPLLQSDDALVVDMSFQAHSNEADHLQSMPEPSAASVSEDVPHLHHCVRMCHYLALRQNDHCVYKLHHSERVQQS
jgi:hypothetical protein